MLADNTYKMLFALIAKGIGNDVAVPGKEGVDYSLLVDMLQRHSVSTLAVDGLQQMGRFVSLSDLPNIEVRDKWMAWYGQSIADEAMYEKHQKLLAKFTRLFEHNNINTLLLKGIGISYLYPQPNHRQCGDIDVVFFHKRSDGCCSLFAEDGRRVGELADDIVKGKGVAVKQDGEKHSTYTLEGVTIENHANFVGSAVHTCLLPLEEFFGKELNHTEQKTLVTPKGKETTLYLPSPDTNALFLAMHLAFHFFHGEANLRQLCDWAVFVRESKGRINWEQVKTLSTKSGYYRFLCAVNGIVQDYLAVPADCLPGWERDKKLEQKILRTILFTEHVESPNIIKKIYRYFGNKWKYDLVFNDNMYLSSLRLARAYIHEQWVPNAGSLWKGHHK